MDYFLGGGSSFTYAEGNALFLGKVRIPNLSKLNEVNRGRSMEA